MARLDSFLEIVAEQKASDFHFHAGNPPIIRYGGELLALPFRTLTDDEVRRFVFEILTPAQRQTLDHDQQLDFIHVLPGLGRFRANVFVQKEGLGAVFRVIPEHLPSFEELRLPPAVRWLTDQANGLVLVTGPTGSGKTTTLAAMVNEINATTQRHVITIEDPIEFVHVPAKSVVTQRQIGRHAESFAQALRSALREAPDVLVVGELRDPETVHLALQAAETGVLVLGTLHTNSAPRAVDRILDALPADIREPMRQVLSVTLRGVLAQRLCPRASGDGRVALLEILLQTHGIANLIRENKVHQIEGLLHSASADGTGAQSLDACILRYIQEGTISRDDGVAMADRPEQLQKQLAEMPEDR
jgi:twitching motility protein PilT